MYQWSWPCAYNILLDDCNSYSIQPAQCNINGFRLLHHTNIFPIPMMTLLQPSLWIKVQGAQVKRHFCNQGDRRWHIQYRLAHSCLHLAYLGCVQGGIECVLLSVTSNYSLNLCAPTLYTVIHSLGCSTLVMGIGKHWVSCSSLNLAMLHWTGWMEYEWLSSNML